MHGVEGGCTTWVHMGLGDVLFFGSRGCVTRVLV